MSNGDGSPFAANLRLAQSQQGFTNKQLAEEVGVRVREVARWRYGHVRPTYPNVRKIARALDKPTDWFFIEREG